MRRDEQLSALMDDQLEDDQLRFLLQGLKNDSDARQKWRRYHMIGDAMRGASSRSLETDLSAAVMAEISVDQQPTQHFADDGGLSAEPAWVKRLVSFAVAASVATVAVFVANDQGLFDPATDGPAYVASVADNRLASSDAVNSSPAFMSDIQASTVASSVAEWNEVPSDIQRKLNQYLLNPAPTVAGIPTQDLSQFIRLVGYREQADADNDVRVVDPALAVDADQNDGVTQPGGASQ